MRNIQFTGSSRASQPSSAPPVSGRKAPASESSTEEAIAELSGRFEKVQASIEVRRGCIEGDPPPLLKLKESAATKKEEEPEPELKTAEISDDKFEEELRCEPTTTTPALSETETPHAPLLPPQEHGEVHQGRPREHAQQQQRAGQRNG